MTNPEASTEAPPYVVPRPPSHLRKHGKQLWRAVCADWEIEADSDDLEVLALAASAADRAADAREELRKAGTLIWEDRLGNIRPRPEVDIEHKARAQAAALVEQVGRSQTRFKRLTMAVERQERATERAARAEDPRRRSRRGGGSRHWPRPSDG